MKRKFFKYSLMAALVLLVTGLCGWLVAKNLAENIAADKAQSMIADAAGDETYKPARVIDIADAVFRNFKHQNPSNVLLLRLRPYLTNRRLPDFLRLKGEKDVFQTFSDQSDMLFYSEFADAAMAAEGDDLKLESTLPHLDEVLQLGEIDGSDKDVRSAAKQNGFGPYWNYMGHKYNREWVRIMHVGQDVKIVMTLVDSVENSVMIADPAPQVDGKTMTWHLKAGEALSLHDGRAKISLRRMNSYIGVDQIAFYPEGS